jgi:hypothetical protein
MPLPEEGGSVRVAVTAQTSAGQISRVSVSVMPANLSTDLVRDGTGAFVGTVRFVPAGVSQTLTATAWTGLAPAGTGSGSVIVANGETKQLSITVLDATGPAARPDHSPVITSLTASAASVALGDPVALGATALDVDGDATTFAWSAAPAGCGTFASSTSASTTWTAAALGTCAITVRASAGGLSDSRSTNIQVGALAGTPTLVQHLSSSSNEQNGLRGNDFRFTLPDPVLAGNCLILGVTFGADPFSVATDITAIADSSGDAWATVPVITATDNGTAKSAIFVRPNATAGIHTITVTLNAPVTLFQYTVSELNDIDTVSPVNGAMARTAAVAGGGVSTGNLTPGNNDARGGNLIWAYFADDSTPFATVPTNYAPVAGFKLLDGSIGTNSSQLPHGSMYIVQTTAALITPSMTLTGGGNDTWSGLAVALRAKAAGSAPPPGIRIRSLIHETAAQPPATWAMQFPSAGNLLVIRVNGDPNLTSITDSKLNTYVKAAGGAGSVEPQIWYAANATPDNALKVTLHFSARPANRTVLLYDVLGAATSSPVDVSVDNRDDAAPGTRLPFELPNSPTITPVSANGLTIAGIGLGIGPVDGFGGAAPAGAIMDFVYYTFDEDSDRMDSGDGAAHFFNPDKSTENWSWHIPNVGSNGSCGSVSACSIYGGSAVHFRAAPPPP